MDPESQPTEEQASSDLARARRPRVWTVLFAFAAGALLAAFLTNPVLDRVLPAELAASVAFKPLKIIALTGWWRGPTAGDPEWTEWSQGGQQDPWGEEVYERYQRSTTNHEYRSSGPNRIFGDADDIGLSNGNNTPLVVILQSVPGLWAFTCVTSFWLGLAVWLYPHRFSGPIEAVACLLISVPPGIAVWAVCPVLGITRMLASGLPSLLVPLEASVGATYTLALALSYHLLRSRGVSQQKNRLRA